MGFRLRKSIGSKHFRMNISKSGIGYSTGTKGMTFTRKANGGSRQTISIPGTGISHVTNYGENRKKENSNKALPDIEIYEEPACSEYPDDPLEPLESILLISFMISLWFLLFVPLAIGLVMLGNHCVALKKFKNMCYSKIDHVPDLQIINENCTWNIVKIVFLCCLWFLIFPIFKARNLINLYMSEYDQLKHEYEKKCEEEHRADIEYRKNLQKALFPDRNLDSLLSREQLLLQAKWDIDNCQRIVKDCAYIVESTTNIDTFFYRLNLTAEKYQCLIPLEGLIEFEGYTPTEAYNGIIDQRDREIELFVNRYIAFMVDNAASLKTERGKINRYKNSLETFRNHYHEISAENINMIESAFATLIGQQV